MNKLMSLVLLAAVLMSGCAWVKPTDSGVLVRVKSFEQIKTCEKIGGTTVAVMHEIAFVARSEQKVAEELETLARNSGADMGGNTVVAVSKIIDGEQAFNVYRCGL